MIQAKPTTGISSLASIQISLCSNFIKCTHHPLCAVSTYLRRKPPISSPHRSLISKIKPCSLCSSKVMSTPLSTDILTFLKTCWAIFFSGQHMVWTRWSWLRMVLITKALISVYFLISIFCASLGKEWIWTIPGCIYIYTWGLHLAFCPGITFAGDCGARIKSGWAANKASILSAILSLLPLFCSFLKYHIF